MPDKVKAVPEGFHTLTPHITVRDATRAIDFYQKAFGAEVLRVSHGPEGKIMHADLKIGDSILMLNDEFPEWGALGPPPEAPARCLPSLRGDEGQWCAGAAPGSARRSWRR